METESFTGDVIYPAGTGPRPLTVLKRYFLLYLAYALIAHVFSRYPDGHLNTNNPLKILFYYAGGYLLLFLLVVLPFGVLPSLARRKTTGFWRSMNEMLAILPFIFGLLIYGGWYADHRAAQDARCGPHHHWVDAGDSFNPDKSCEPDRAP